jgi:uncharacterized protein (DUF2252 family)
LKKSSQIPEFKERQTNLTQRRNLKMARSAHAYVRGNTLKFYEWLDTTAGGNVPEGPAMSVIWGLSPTPREKSISRFAI